MLSLYPNEKIENQPVVVRKIDKKVGQNDKGYYHLQISYGIKSYDAKIWNDSPEIGDKINPGCLAYITGVAKDFKGTIQIHINKIEKIENPSQDLINKVIPSCYLNSDEMEKSLFEIINTINNIHIKQLLNNIFTNDTIKNAFFKKAAGAEIHHAYVGGLAQHTLEVARIVINFTQVFPYVNYDIAVASALLHDIGKIAELSDFPENKYTTRGKLIGHINIGVEILNSFISKIPDFPNQIKYEIEHCILSHHGTLEMGSPVLPMTIEAIAVHNADKSSAEINAFHLAIERDTGTDAWTDYNPTYKRAIKKSINI
ncbi:3'-5' exoribonuclease YhaM family protein [Thermobrachium celere]|uniref:3'-5' exoribonuclease YhaM( EC:3.1.-) n=1 Tax=Thermobrachium celere DSM 8682 TaxID=941824 RepID=R7RTL7_9CLOT|nr:HD domain-containing protein [Thermobrachium celere]CDF58575.1 3'-5' exoribonuclease YhaM(EC:3.1.-) [Thermobrachium celere DSM 8682]